MIFDRIFGVTTTHSKLSDPMYWMGSMMGGYSTAAKVDVTESTAMSVSAYFACIRNISEDIATLPLCVYRKKPGGGRERLDGTGVADDISYLLRNNPNPITSAWTWRQVMAANAASWGNSYAEIVRDNRNRPKALWQIHPSRVRQELQSVDGMLKMVYYVTGQLDGKMTTIPIDSADMIHFKGLSVDGFTGLSVLQAAKETIGTAVAEQEFIGGFLGNGASLSGVLTHPQSLSKDAADRLRQSWGEAFRGAKNAGKAAVLEEGMTWAPMSVPQKDAQFLENRKLTIEEIARWFRMPPHKIMHLERATFSNIESQDRQYVNDTLMPWLTRFEEELGNKLFSATELNRGFFISHKVDGRLRGDSTARAEFYRGLLNMGSISPNEIRELENMNPIGPAGDQYFMQLAMTTLERIVEGEPEPTPPPPPADPPGPPPTAAPEPPDDPDNSDEPPMAARVMIEHACNRVVAKTEKAFGRGERDPEWVRDFYAGQAKYLAQEMAAICRAFGGTLQGLTGIEEGLFHRSNDLASYITDHWRHQK